MKTIDGESFPADDGLHSARFSFDRRKLMSDASMRVARREFLKTTVAGTALSACLDSTPDGSVSARDTISTSPASFPFYRAEGTHRELGRQHGEQAKEQIGKHLDLMRNSMNLTRQSLNNRALTFRPLFEQHCPHLIDEILGLGEGAGISFAEALATNIRGALTQARNGGCTSFVISGEQTRDGRVLIGQNSDMMPSVIDLAYVLHMKPKGKPEVLMWSFGGMIGYHGINSLGVGNFANDLGGGPAPRFGMPHYPVKRLMLECSTLDEITQLLRRIPLWANGNYVLCDAEGEILDVEATTDGQERISDNGDGFIAHSNHFICSRFATRENHKLSAEDSFPRLDRMNHLIKARVGDLTSNDLKRFLRDRAGNPNGICRVAQTDDPTASWMTAGITVASIVAEPKKQQMHIALGNGTDSPFKLYRMDQA